MTDSIQRAKFRFRDWLRYSRLPRELLGLSHHLKALLARDPASRANHLLEACRFSTIEPLKRHARTQLRPSLDHPFWREKRVGWQRYAGPLESPALTRTVILKAPGRGGEKGVMIVTFEYNWLRILERLPVLRELERRYDLVFSTSSSPTSYQMLALAVSSLEGTVFVMPCNHLDIPEIEALHPRLKCLPMLPCDWLEPSLFQPTPRNERDIDILMVANWHPVKRHWQFFEALSRMDPKLRIVMVGQQADQFDLGFVKHAARLFRAPQQIEFHESLPIEEVAALQCRSRTSAIFSRREGCCVAVTESLMADTPVALVADAHIGPKAYINRHTGVLIERGRQSGPQLEAFLRKADEFQPRAWAEKHLSAPVSTRKLAEILRENALAEGRPWTTGLLTPCWRAHPTLRHHPEGESLRSTYSALHHEHPELFPADLFDQSHR